MTAVVMGLTSWAQVPKADLLDVVFNDDGTATDVSECQNVVELFGTPNVVESSKYGINVACFHENVYNTNCSYWYKVDYGSNVDFTEGLADGHSLEVLCRLELDGNYADLIGAGNEIKPFSSHQSGGTGFMVCTRTTDESGAVTRGNEWTFLPHVNGGYQWTNSGVPAVGGEYVHLVGVWDKEKGESRIYVNGELKFVNPDATGDFKQSSLTYFVVGGDPGGSGANTAFKGDVAIARVYDDPLTDAQVASLYGAVQAMDTGAEEHVDQVVYDPYFSFIPTGHNIELTELEEPYSFELVTTGDDPYISMSPLQKPLEEDQTVITFEYICPMGALGSEFFFSINGSYQGGREITFDIPAADDWTTFYLDLSNKMTDFNWGHAIGELLRWDIGSAAGITLDVRNIHFITKSEYQEAIGGIGLPQDADGWCLVSSPEDLMKFAEVVNSGAFRNINVRLTEDIDMGGVDWTPIGVGPCYNKASGPGNVTNEGFAGVFDGQGHIVSNFNIVDEGGEAVGLFGIVTGTVKNVGVIGATYNATHDCRAGGIAGVVIASSARAGLVENCYVTNSVILTTERVCGGVVGAVSGATVQNCYGLFNELSGYGERFGGVAGDTNNDSNWAGTVNNCYTDYGRVTSSQYGSTLNSQAGVSAERFANGEMTYKLNGSTTNVESVWRQNIGEDPYPVLDKSRGYVMPAGTEYISFSDDNFKNVRDEIIAEESEFNANTVCAYELTDSYEEILGTLGEASTMEEFFQAYDEVAALKKLLIASAASYAAYQTKIDEVSAYLDENNNFTGPDREKLENYLNENVEPGEDYPNGSYEYIIENRLLDNDALAEEIAFVQALLDKAIESGYEEGADITNLLSNADFSDGTNGWTIEGGSMSIANVSGAGVQHVGESGSKINLSKTLKGLIPGFYQVKVNAAYRAAGDNNNLNQASFLYANNNKVYLPTLREGIIPADSESPNLDRYNPVEDEDGIYIGYMPTSTNALAYAFGDGYYQSTIVTEVGEDGVLTLGITTPGCNKANTTWVGAFHLFYCGAADTGYTKTAIDETLEGQAARLSTLANDYVYDEYEFAAAPNYSEALKAEVQAQAESATSASDKLAKIAELGDLMQKVYDCKQAYAGMMAQAEVILDLYSNMALSGMLSDEEANIMDQAYTTVSDAYLDGSYSLEEAQAANPFANIPFMPDIENNVAKISEPRQLMVFSAMVNSGFYRELDAVLENDIDMSEVSFYPPIGYATLSELNHTGQPITNPGYAGTFDGQGHVIKNLTASYSASYATSGVFGTITGTVKNLGISGYYFDNGQAYSGRFGALCGQLVEGLILNCYVVNSTVIDTNEIVSAIAAGNYAGTVQNCYGYNNNIQPYPRAGHLIGDARDDNGVRVGTEINCYSEGFVTGAGRTNGYASNMEGCESNVSAARFQSGEIAYLLNGGATEGEDLVWYQTIRVDESPVLDKTHSVVRKTDSGAYTNSDDTNADLLALVSEAQALCATTKIVGHEALITSGDQLSDNCLWQGGYEIQKIIDGDQMTYFHSRIDTDLSLGTEYFQVALPAPVQGFYLDYWGRSDGAGTGNIWHDTPDKIRIEGTNTPEDESSWVVISTEEYDIPDIDGAHYVSEEPIMLGGAYQYIRFYILHSTHGMAYWNITEFQMFNAGENDQSQYDADPEIAKAVDAVEACAAEKEQKAISGSGTQADIDELQALIDQLREVTGIIKEHKGTKEDPFQIASAEDFVNLHSKMKTGETTYVILTKDIDMSEVENWVPLNDWSNQADGKNWMNWIDLNGMGHVISNLTSTSESGYDYASVFGVLCGNVRNVGFENVTVSCTNTGSGVLGGYMGHTNFTDEEGNKLTSTIENVWVTGTLNVSSSYCGGLIGNIGGPSIIKNCYTNLNIVSEAPVTGGIVGRVRDALTMQNVYAAGTMNTGGGIIGGGQNSSTPASTYTNCVVWNNTDKNFGIPAEGDALTGISYYDGSNFAALQQTVVGWGSPWICDMADGSYPVFDKEKLAVTGEEEQPLVADHSRKLLLETSQLSDNCYWVFPSLDMSVNTLLDGSMTTHFHSDATNATPLSQLNQYIQMDLREAQKAVQIYFAGRNLEPIGPVTNPSIEMINTPNHIIILASNTPDDEESWKQVAEFTNGFPGVVVGGEYYSPCFDMGGEYRYLRMVVKGAEQSQVYWNISELQVYPAKGATGIEQLMVQPVRMQSNGIYSIDGRLISRDPADVKSLSKGLYIIGGRKVAVK